MSQQDDSDISDAPDVPDVPELHVKKRELNQAEDEELEVLNKCRRVASAGSDAAAEKFSYIKVLDKEYFSRMEEYLIKKQEQTEAEKALYKRELDFKENPGKYPKKWYETAPGRNIIAKQRIYQAALKHSTNVREKYTTISASIEFAAVTFMNTFLRQALGRSDPEYGASKFGVGKRNQSTQTAFRKGLIKSYDALRKDEDKGEIELWDCVFEKYQRPLNMVASHIFERQAGNQILELLFGDECKDEIHTFRNGLLLDEVIEKAFDAFALVFVPDIDNPADMDQVKAWEKQHPREYKIRVIDPTHTLMKKQIDFKSQKMQYKDLNGKKLVFKSDKRPRARFIYWRYLLAMYHRLLSLNKNDSDKKAEIFYEHTLRYCWPTIRGAHMERAHFQVFREVLGENMPDTTSSTALQEIESNERLDASKFGVLKGQIEALSPGHLAVPTDENQPPDSGDEDEDEDEDGDEDLDVDLAALSFRKRTNQ